jgi:RNA polymerase sigma-70 factor, ECF subfamily
MSRLNDPTLFASPSTPIGGPLLGSDPSDFALIAQWKAGDHTAATLLVERHSQALARYAASLGAREDIEELVQDTLVRAFNSLDSFRGESSLRSWLFTIERRLVLDRRRAERRRRGQITLAEVTVGTEYTALDSLIAEETSAKLQRIVQALSPMQREVFTLRVVEGLSYKEIAGVLDTSEGAARVHYHNAMKVVRESLR